MLIGDIFQSLLGVIISSFKIFGWSLVFYGQHSPLILTLSLIPVGGRALYVWRRDQWPGFIFVGIEIIVETSRALLVVLLIGIEGLFDALQGLIVALGNHAGLLVGQYLTLGLIFLGINGLFSLVTGEIALFGWKKQIGPAQHLSEQQRLVLTFALKNLIVIPLFIICLYKLSVSALT